MIRINQLKLPITHTGDELLKKAAKALKISPEDILDCRVVRQSIDARKREQLLYIYAVDITLAGKKEESVLHKAKNPNAAVSKDRPYMFSIGGKEPLKAVPVIIGTGPAGLFAGLMLARNGFCPLLLERGEDVESRKRKVESFWDGGILDPDSNVQFGEGGAGTFSDGKLNTLVKDPMKRNYMVLKTFVEFGADPEILYQSKPHIGTDVLSLIVKNMREEIIRLGGQVRFSSQVTDISLEGGRITGLTINGSEQMEVQAVILAVGHSARDTFDMMWRRGVPMEQKAFAVGLRIQHPQQMINLSQYGEAGAKILGAASYKVTHQCASKRGVYSFCMCPGGYVVNASSEQGRLAVNGMSNHAREGENANSALIVTVTPEDFCDKTPLGGIAFQRELEDAAFQAAQGKIPLQLYGDFKNNRISTAFGDVAPQLKGLYAFADLRGTLPSFLTESLIEGVEAFDRMIGGFGRYDAILAGIESRTSSPVRIPRNTQGESEVAGLYPCGEGAGYAGGITSAAMDGIRAAEAVAARYAPLS